MALLAASTIDHHHQPHQHHLRSCQQAFEAWAKSDNAVMPDKQLASNNNNNCLFVGKPSPAVEEDSPSSSSSNTYQPNSSSEDKSPSKILNGDSDYANMIKPAASKQNVKYDSATGKVYEELGCPSSGSTSSSTAAIPDYSSTFQHQPYQTYPYQSQTTSYPMGTGSSNFGATTATGSGPYSSSLASVPYSSYAAPRAFVPHSAINLSVKTSSSSSTSAAATASEAGMQSPPSSSLDLSVTSSSAALDNGSSSNQYLQQIGGGNNSTSSTSDHSPQILDLTRPIGSLVGTSATPTR